MDPGTLPGAGARGPGHNSWLPDREACLGAGSALVALVLPVLCVGCGRELANGRRALCGPCFGGLERIGDDRCRDCAQPLPCAPCPASLAPWDRAVAACSHAGVTRSLVAALKHSGARRVAGLMAAEIARATGPGLWQSRAVVPVAPHPGRRRGSGVDHSRVLAAALAAITGRPLVEPLRRVGRETRQAGAGRKLRTEPGRIGFEVIGHPPARVVLVDDVHTTGATLAAATDALRSAGCSSVACASFARALLGPPRLPRPSDW